MTSSSASTTRSPSIKWSDFSDSESVSSVDVSAEAKNKLGLLLFYNLNISGLVWKNHRGNNGVSEVLKLNPDVWNLTDFSGLKVVDVAVGGVSVDYRYKQDDSAATVVSIAFVLVETGNMTFDNQFVYSKGRKELKWYRPSSVGFCNLRTTRFALSRYSNQEKVGLHALIHDLEYPSNVIKLLAKMTIGHHDLLKSCESNKALRRHQEWNDGISKVLQRIGNIFSSEDGQVPLTCCPCHLGYSDANDWNAIGDPCGSSKLKLHDLLNHACHCGRLTFKPHNEDSTKYGYRIPQSSWKGVLIHYLKENIMQSLVGGEVHQVVKGNMTQEEYDSEDGLWHAFEINGEENMALENLSPKNHICFLVDTSKVNDEHVESGNLDLTALDRLISCGEFHICGPWTGGPAKRLLLPKGTRFRGKLILWIGGYVGDCVYAMETIIQSFRKPITYALKDLLAIHANENDDHQDDSISEDGSSDNGSDIHDNHADSEKSHNDALRTQILPTVSVNEVALELKKLGFRLSPEQEEYVNSLPNKKHCRSCAGSGKTTIGNAILAAALKKVKALSSKDGISRKIVWLTPNREQRDEALNGGRKILDNPLAAAGVGRPCGQRNNDVDDLSFDSLTEQMLWKKFEDITNELNELEKNCIELQKRMLEGTDDMETRRSVLEQYYRREVD